MVGVEEGREFRFRGDLYSQESTFPLVLHVTDMFWRNVTYYVLARYIDILMRTHGLYNLY